MVLWNYQLSITKLLSATPKGHKYREIERKLSQENFPKSKKHQLKQLHNTHEAGLR